MANNGFQSEERKSALLHSHNTLHETPSPLPWYRSTGLVLAGNPCSRAGQHNLRRTIQAEENTPAAHGLYWTCKSMARAAKGTRAGQPDIICSRNPAALAAPWLCRRCAEVIAGAWGFVMSSHTAPCEQGNWARPQVFACCLERGVGGHKVGGLQAGLASPGSAARDWHGRQGE